MTEPRFFLAFATQDDRLKGFMAYRADDPRDIDDTNAFPDGTEFQAVEISEEMYHEVKKVDNLYKENTSMRPGIVMMFTALKQGIGMGMPQDSFESAILTMEMTLLTAIDYQLPENYSKEDVEVLLRKARDEIKTTDDAYKKMLLMNNIIFLEEKLKEC
jgi:hypothetical protein